MDPETGYVEYEVNDMETRRTRTGCDVSRQSGRHPTLFVFAYDWRYSIDFNAQKLSEYVGFIQEFYLGTKVNIIAHSMGGHVALRYILEYGGDLTVKKLIAFGTPWLGLPQILSTMLTGVWPNVPINPDIVKDLVVYFDGPHQLLPSARYFDTTPYIPLREIRWDLNNNGNAWESYTTLDQL